MRSCDDCRRQLPGLAVRFSCFGCGRDLCNDCVRLDGVGDYCRRCWERGRHFRDRLVLESTRHEKRLLDLRSDFDRDRAGRIAALAATPLVTGLALGACDSPISVEPPTPPVSPPVAPAPAPRRDELAILADYASVTAFSLSLFSAEVIHAFCVSCLDENWRVFRTGGELADWGGDGYTPRGPEPLTPAWEQNLRTLLATTARLGRGASLQLIPVFTIKGRSAEYCRRVAGRTAQIVLEGEDSEPYRHVIWEAVNEGWYASRLSERDIADLMRLLRETGLPVGTDARGEGITGPTWDPVYPRRLEALADYVSFHPPRNPQPSVDQYRRAVRRYGPRTQISETVAYASSEEIAAYGLHGRATIVIEGRGTEDERRAEIRRNLDAMREAGIRPNFHSIAGFGDRMGWLPRWEG